MTTATTSRPTRRPGLAGRLLLGQLIILATAVAVAVTVSSAVGPALFRSRLVAAGQPAVGTAADRAESAFHSANSLDLALASAVVLVLSVVVGLLLARRLQRSAATLADAAARIGAGDYHARISLPTPTPEADRIASAINQLATRLEATETTRRRLLADLAHELRTPVNTLNGYLEGIHDGVVRPSTEVLTLLRGQTGRLTRLIDDIGTVSAAEEGRLVGPRAPVDVGELLSATAAAARGTAATEHPTKHLTIQIQPTEPLTVWADRDRLDQVLANLLNNALRHSRPHGTVTLAARDSHDQVTITVHDDGDGIAAEHLPHLFERFYRTDPARARATGGFGIGLTIAAAITTAHGGRLTADSPGPGQGATFTVQLPATPRR